LVKLVVPAGLARSGPPLSPILGQAQIKVIDFVTQFNAVTAEFTPGVPLPVVVVKTAATKFTLQVAPPTVSTLLWGVTTARTVSRVDLWGVIEFRYGRVTPAVTVTVLGTLKSTRLTAR